MGCGSVSGHSLPPGDFSPTGVSLGSLGVSAVPSPLSLTAEETEQSEHRNPQGNLTPQLPGASDLQSTRVTPSQCSPLPPGCFPSTSFPTTAQTHHRSLLLTTYVTSNIFVATNNTTQHFCPFFYLCVFPGFCAPLLLPCCSPPAHSSPTKLAHSRLCLACPLCLGTLFPQVLPWLTPAPPSSLCSKASKLGTLQSPHGKLQSPPHLHTTTLLQILL